MRLQGSEHQVLGLVDLCLFGGESINNFESLEVDFEGAIAVLGPVESLGALNVELDSLIFSQVPLTGDLSDVSDLLDHHRVELVAVFQELHHLEENH